LPELPPFSQLVGHMLRDYVPASVELQVAVAIREYAKSYALSALSAQEAEVGRLMGDLRASEEAELGAQSANRHLSALVDFERQVSERCMAVMKALMDAAEPVNNEFQDCHIDYADYAKFVDAHAELLYVIKNGERPAALTQGETK
jgi:hypothetical protein